MKRQNVKKSKSQNRKRDESRFDVSRLVVGHKRVDHFACALVRELVDLVANVREDDPGVVVSVWFVGDVVQSVGVS